MRHTFLETEWCGGERISEWVQDLAQPKGERRFVDCIDLKRPGMYLIVLDPVEPPEFEKKLGKKFNAADCKNNDELSDAQFESCMLRKWVVEEPILYIGKATKSVKRRLIQYLNYGRKDKSINHRGGRYIWLLKNFSDLRIYWKPATQDAIPSVEETRLIEKFKAHHDSRLPFANMINGKLIKLKREVD